MLQYDGRQKISYILPHLQSGMGIQSFTNINISYNIFLKSELESSSIKIHRLTTSYIFDIKLAITLEGPTKFEMI